jgi:DNA-binding GntR family transcriptional regulator
MPPVTPPKPTRTDEVHARLRADILGGRLLPGQRLKFPDLAVRYEASVGVIREALIRLTEHGLVRSEAHLGFQVAPVSEAGHAELSDARLQIETLVLRRAIADGDLAWEERLVAAHHRLDRTPLTDPAAPEHPTPEWLMAHAAYHHTLLDGCANRRLLAMANALREEAELYRRWSHPDPDAAPAPAAPTAPTDPAPPDEHRELLDAALARDPDRASDALSRLITLSAGLRVSAPPR